MVENDEDVLGLNAYRQERKKKYGRVGYQFMRGWWAFKRMVSNIHYRGWMKPIQCFKNWRDGYGWFPDEDGFEFAHKLVRYALPRLKYMRAECNSGVGHLGGPANVRPVFFNEDKKDDEVKSLFNEWKRIQDDMIFWLETYNNGYIERDGGKIYDFYFKEKAPDVYNRMRRGKYYFFKYFEMMWD